MVVTAPRDDVVLRFASGAATFRVRAAGWEGTPWLDYEVIDGPKGRVLVYAADPAGPPVSTHALHVDSRSGRFVGFAPGTYTLWIDLAPLPPVVVRGVHLGPGPNDLGEVAFSRGTTLRVRVLGQDGREVPVQAATVSPTTDPDYSRESWSSEAGVVEGLGPGAFRVGAMVFLGGSVRWVWGDFTADGSTDVRLDLDVP